MKTYAFSAVATLLVCGLIGASFATACLVAAGVAAICSLIINED